jgi:hypothetical protein
VDKKDIPDLLPSAELAIYFSNKETEISDVLVIFLSGTIHTT